MLSILSLAHGDESLKSRPNRKGPTEVATMLYVLDVREIDGSRQTFAADIFIRMRWNDSRLASEGNKTFSLNEVWNPGIQVVNRITVQSTFPEIVEVDGNGNATYRQRYTGQFSTKMDLKKFPFDRQRISIRFASPGISPAEVRFVPDAESGLGNELSITDWRISSWQTRPESYQVSPGGRSVAGFLFEFRAERYFLFFLVQIVVPMALILGMSWIVFWLDPTQPGPRISISITSMLTIVAYRLLLGNFLPRLSFLTRMDYFVFGSTFLVFLSLGVVVWINRLFLAKKEDQGLRLDKHARWIFPALFVLLLLKCFAI